MGGDTFDKLIKNNQTQKSKTSFLLLRCLNASITPEDYLESMKWK